MKRPTNKTRADALAGIFEPATVVLFAGLGGVCIGVEEAYTKAGFRDRYIDLAVNHWDTAVAVHELNHPMTQHLPADVWEVDPNAVLMGRKIAYLHLSPDCVDFSRAKGSAPKRQHIRALADVGIIWAGKRRPDVISLENVKEFKDWGPLLPNGQPDPARRGQEFIRWCTEFKALGYTLEYRTLRARQHGIKTSRERLFVIMRCDGKPIVWPEITHGSKKEIAARKSLKLQGPAHECIDYSIPMLSIFATREEARSWSIAQNVGRPRHQRVGIPQRPLKPKTHRRLSGGLDKWVLQALEPFTVSIENYGWNSSASGRPVSEPLSTVTASPKGGKHAVVDVSLTSQFASTLNHGGDHHRSSDLRSPLATITGANDARALVSAKLAPFTIPRHGEAPGQEPRSGSLQNPMPTVTATGNGAGLVGVVINKHYGGVLGQSPRDPLGTVTSVDHHSLMTAHIVKFRGDSIGSPIDEPLPTVTSGAGAARDAGAAHAMGLATVYLSQMYGSNSAGARGGDVSQPLGTVTGSGQHSKLCVVYLQPYYGQGSGQTGHTPAEPLPTIPATDRFSLVSLESTPHWLFTEQGIARAKLVGAWAREQLGCKVDDNTIWVDDAETGERFPLLFVRVNGDIHLITDILIRMLKARELARAQGFPDWYIIDRDVHGNYISNADQVKLIGNSVPPTLAELIATENVVKLRVFEDAGRVGAA